MPNLFALAAPLALLLPISGPAGSAEGEAAGLRENSGNGPVIEGSSSSRPTATRSASTPLEALYAEHQARQVRIEQRVVVRISPRRSTTREMLAELPRQPLNSRFEERKTDNCLPVNRIAGVQTGSGNRLLLFMRDQRIITVNLEKACRARDFYSGFYVERNEDGNICVDRDKLQSRSGAKCEVERMRQLVAVEN